MKFEPDGEGVWEIYFYDLVWESCPDNFYIKEASIRLVTVPGVSGSGWSLFGFDYCSYDDVPVFECLQNTTDFETYGILQDFEALAELLTLDWGTDVSVSHESDGTYLVFCEASASVPAPLPDADGDGVPDDVDACPDSDLGETIIINGIDSGVANRIFGEWVDISGCSMADYINCSMVNEAQAALASGRRQPQGAFRSGMAHYLESQVVAGVLLEAEKDSIQSAVARISRHKMADIAAGDPCP